MKKTLCVYIHGFESSPNSTKAQQMAGYFAEHYPEAVRCIAPSMSHWPFDAVKDIENTLAQYPDHQPVFVGSSLGGFFTLFLTEQFKTKGVLINPAIRPYDHGDFYIGRMFEHYGEPVKITPRHIDQLKELSQTSFRAQENYLLLLQEDDELLDYQHAIDLLPGAHKRIYSGGGHRFSNFSDVLPDIAWFLGLKEDYE